MKKNNKKFNKKALDKVAIEVKNVSKNFRIPHEKISSIRGAFIGFFKKKSYENLKALDKVSFKVEKGEFFGIVGRNGSGKSTLLKTLAGIYQPDSGEIKIDGLISPFLELGIGFNPELSGRDNVYLNATVLGMTKKEIDKKFDDIVKFAELERFIDQRLKKYSSGMQVRLAFAVSIHANRDILLMDEVLAVGDNNFQSKCLEEFNKYREMGRTVVIVTHDVSVVERYCDRALLLKKGEIVKIGKADEVVDEYVQSNMTDEEKRLQAEELAKKEEGKKIKTELKKDIDKKVVSESKKAEIIDVEFLDKDGRSKSVFETGESMKVKIEYKVNEEIEKINFAFGIHSEFSGPVFVCSTQVDRFKVDVNKKFVYLHFDKIPILKGSYFVNVACLKDVNGICYDFKVRYKKLMFYTKGIENNYVGIVNLDHKWALK